jgi:hypothetical protein
MNAWSTTPTNNDKSVQLFTSYLLHWHCLNDTSVQHFILSAISDTVPRLSSLSPPSRVPLRTMPWRKSGKKFVHERNSNCPPP